MPAMIDFPCIPGPGVRFKLKAHETQLVLYSRLGPDPVVSHYTDGNYLDQIFTLFRGRGEREGQYLIKSWACGKVLFSRTKMDPHVGNTDGDGEYPDNWFRFIQDQNDKESFRIYCPATNTVLFSRSSPDPTFYNYEGPEYNDQLWRFKYLDY